ncbi:hypothetical protein, partial [Roseovarius sp. D22-M7]|uniref:hypothetical protein n=1 Tax=Roseovarius sp. D22-M7 TaxID=3127116 RepID=UPI0030105DDF
RPAHRHPPTCRAKGESRSQIHVEAGFFSSLLGEYEDGSHRSLKELAVAELQQKSADDELTEALQRRDSGSVGSDGIFVYADHFRRSFWPYAIIIAFSLKLASANSARSNEARMNVARAQEVYSEAALAVKPDSRETVRALRKAIRISRRQLRRSETLGQAQESSDLIFNLAESAERIGQLRLAKLALTYWDEFSQAFKPYEETNAGIIEKAKFLQRAGDLLVLLSEDTQAKTHFFSSYDFFLKAQQRSFWDDGFFDLATSIVRMFVVETRLGDDASAKEWLEKLAPLRREMNESQNSEVNNQLNRAKTTLKHLPLSAEELSGMSRDKQTGPSS